VSRNILCVVEFDNYPDEVVSRATWLAKLYDVDLHLLVSDPATDFLGNTCRCVGRDQSIVGPARGGFDSPRG
jgi:hypothetical protein